MSNKKEKILIPLKNGFTLAEVLITLGIIGVVAAMTIPTLVANYQQRSWDTASSVFNRRLGEALKVMNTNSALAGYSTTQDFVNELGKNIKIVKTCDSNHLTDCFTETINTGADPINTSELKKSKNLYKTVNYGTETVGVQFADGVSALIAYNKNFTADPFSSDAVKVTGSVNQKTVGLDTTALSILYDVSGSKSPNSFGTNQDIRGLNINIKTGADVKALGPINTTVNCSSANAGSSDYAKYCGSNPSGNTDDYWAGANKACASEDMRLPTFEELEDLYARKDELGLSASWWIWSSTKKDKFSIKVILAGSGTTGSVGNGNGGIIAWCVAD